MKKTGFKTKETPQEFTFWLANRLDNEYKMRLEAIRVFYRHYLRQKDQAWIEHYGGSSVADFVGSKEGLNSVADKDVYSELQEALKADLVAVMREKQEEEAK